MSKYAYRMLAGVVALSALCFIEPANALTMKQCSEKYKTAGEAGAVGGMTWNDFRAAECGTDATMALSKVKAPAAVQTGPSQQECSARYQAAKKDGTLGSMSWNEFRSAGCIARTATAPSPPVNQKTSRAAAEPTKVSEQVCSARYQAAKSAGTLAGMSWNEFRSAGCPQTIARRSGTMTPTAGSLFPTTISRKYAGELAGRARLLTCRDQYEANKAAGITEPRWTVEGGGYYSECNKRLSQH